MREYPPTSGVRLLSQHVTEDTDTASLLEQIAQLQRDNAVYRRLAYRDALTGLHNRRHFDERIAEEWSRAARFGTPLGLLVIDVNDFKAVNDAHGHAVGDAVLRWVGQQLADACRDYDVPCRIGGDEFAVLLPGSEPDGTAAFAQRLTARFAQHHAVPLLGERSVKLSIGCANADDAGTALELLIRADEAMYRVKRRAA